MGKKAVPLLLTLALYLSGFFVVLTPLPLFYYLLKKRGHVWFEIVIPAFLILAFLYSLLLPPLFSFYQNHPRWDWLLPVPGMYFLESIGHRVVTLFGLVYFLFYVAVAELLSEVAQRKAKHFRPIAVGVFLFFITLIALYLTYTHVKGFAPFDLIKNYFQQALGEFIALQKAGGLSLEQISFLQQNAESVAHYSALLSPAFLFCSLLVIFVLNLFLGKRLFYPFIRPLMELKLNEWVFSFYWVWVVISGLALLLTNSVYLHSTLGFALAANVLLVLAFVYYLQGLVIISYFLDKKEVSPLGRILAYALIFFLFQTLGFLIMGFGFFDAWFDFRKLGTSTKREL